MPTATRSHVDLPATTLTSCHTMTNAGTISVTMLNRTAATITVRLAIINGAPAAVVDEDYCEYECDVPPHRPLIRSGEIVPASWQICGYASATGISMQVHAWEED